MRIVGLDLSITSTGVAIVDQDDVTVRTIGDTTPGHTLLQRLQRLDKLAWALTELCETATLVVVEGPALGVSRQAGTHERAGLWWLMVDRLHFGIEVPVVEVPPATLKRYLTGRGNSAKDKVLIEVARRYPAIDVKNNNEADALGLAAMGCDHLGHPLTTMPTTHRAALDAISWPEPRPT